MRSHADTIRAQGRCPGCGWRTGDGSLCASCYRDALLAENQRLKDEAQDMVLAAAYYEMRVLRDAAVAENQQLREALRGEGWGDDDIAELLDLAGETGAAVGEE